MVGYKEVVKKELQNGDLSGSFKGQLGGGGGGGGIDVILFHIG